MGDHIAVIGLGYVGLPLALAFAEKYRLTSGYDVSSQRIEKLTKGIDDTGEVRPEELAVTSLNFTNNLDEIKQANIFVVCVPTPIHADKRPDLGPLAEASRVLGGILKRGDIVVYESTVYPGVTEEFCGPILAKRSGLRQGEDFKLGYSPERANPGDKNHQLETIVKVVAGEDEETGKKLCALYGAIVPVGIHYAPSIKVAEAAKVLENTQRDVNIALINEAAIIFDLLGLRTADVLAAARTKWNFLDFKPGLVGGHCIGVDPYYLTTIAEAHNYRPEVMLSGRRINDSMGTFIGRRIVRLLAHRDAPLRDARIAIFGITFKENVPDVRNSKSPDIVRELQEYGIRPLVCDPLANPEEVHNEYGIELIDENEVENLDALVFAVPHATYLKRSSELFQKMAPESVLIDVKSVFNPKIVPASVTYWSL